MRKIGIALGAIVLILIVGALVFVATFDVNTYRGTIQTQLEKRLGRPVTLGNMQLRLLPPRFRVQDLAIADDPSFNPKTPFVKAQVLDVSVKLLPLLKKEVKVDSLYLQHPVIALIRNPQGVWNFSSLGKPAAPTLPSASQPPSPAPAGQQTAGNQGAGSQPSPAEQAEQFSLAKLTIQDGQLSVLDQKVSKQAATYDHIDVTLRNFVPYKPFTIDASARLPGAGSQEVRLQGEGGPVNQNQAAATPFHGTLDLKRVRIADLSKYLNAPALNDSDGVITGSTRIDNDSGKLTAKGSTRIDNPKINKVELGYPVDASYDLTDELNSDLITMRNVTLKLGSTPVVIAGTVNAKSSPAQLNLNLKADNVSLQELARLAAASGSLTPGINVNGNGRADIQAHGPANKPALNGNVALSNVQMSGGQIAQPVQIQSMNLRLTPSQIQSDPFNVTSGGTTVNAQMGVNNYLSAPVVNATAEASNAQLPAVLSIARAYGVKALDKVDGSGVLNLDLHASGPVKSLDSNEIMRTLNGTLNLNLHDVKYTGADIGQELSSIAALQGAAPNTQGVTRISKLTGDMVVKNGIAQTNNLQAQTDFGTLGVAGTANLADQSLNLKALTVLSQAFSQKVGGTQVGRFARTALANNQGELTIPVLITGTFSSPKLMPDTQQMAQMKLKGLLPSASNPASAMGALNQLLGGKGGLPTGQGQQQQAQPNGQQPAAQDSVQQILGLFGKKKK